MTAPTYAIPGVAPGRLLIGPHPVAQDLPAVCGDLQAAGVTRVVSLLTLDEAEMLGLGHQAATCAEAGLAYDNLPIPDFALPDHSTLSDLVATLSAALAAGDTVFVHCRAGIGRSGVVASALLIARGVPPAVALETVSRARGHSVPDTDEQTRFILALPETE